MGKRSKTKARKSIKKDVEAEKDKQCLAELQAVLGKYNRQLQARLVYSTQHIGTEIKLVRTQ